MCEHLRLPRPERLFVRRLDRKTRDADLRIRCRILLKVHQGLTPHAAALEIGCVPSTAWRVARRFSETGIAALFDRRKENGTRKVDDNLRAQIVELMGQTPADLGFSRETWTLELVQRVIAEKQGVTISVGHLCRVMHEMKIRWGIPKPIVGCPWESARREKRIRELRKLRANPGPGQPVLFVDEVDIDLNPKIGRDWMLPGTQRRILTPGKNEKRYLAGAYDPVRQRMVYVEGEKKAGRLFLNLLRAILEAYPRTKKIHLILDNDIIHKCAPVQAWLRLWGHRFRLHFLPPYCPDENWIERIWRDLHANVTRNHRCRSIGELLEAVRRYLNARFHTHEGFCPA